MVNIINRPISFAGETFTPRNFDNNNFTMDWETVKGNQVPLHFHRHMDEHFTVTKGEATFTVNGETIVKKEGETLLVPKMTPHSIANKTNDSIGLRVTYTPNADAHKMFQAWAMFQDNGDSMLTGMTKWLYIQEKLDWQKFSEPADGGGKAMFAVFGALANLFGGLFAWKKYLDKF